MSANGERKYLAVAIDHGTSFERWLSRWNADAGARVAVKLAFVGMLLDAHIDGLVIGIDLIEALPSVVSMATGKAVDTWIGLPDQVVHGSYFEARTTASEFPLCAGVWLAHLRGASGIKVGFSLARHARWKDALDWLSPASELASRLDVGIVVEPYFGVQDTGPEREGFLRDVSNVPMVRFCKLDVHDPTTWGEAYKRGATQWLARSEGLEYAQFLRNVKKSMRFGCVGTIAGGAVWGIKDKYLLSSAFVDEVHRRLAELRKQFPRPMREGGTTGNASERSLSGAE